MRFAKGINIVCLAATVTILAAALSAQIKTSRVRIRIQLVQLRPASPAGMSVTDDVYRKAVTFLLSTQYLDGSWLVRTRAFPVQPYFESGFPFGRHQWISAAGTAWAARAIALTLPDVNRSALRE
jgi:hypothetical protein